MAAIDLTYHVLKTVLNSEPVLNLFKTIAQKRIAEKAVLVQPNQNVDQQLAALKDADLIDTVNGDKYFPTAKGLQVARDLEKITP
jgi:hypothetical protein